jgi:hypothetical protein
VKRLSKKKMAMIAVSAVGVLFLLLAVIVSQPPKRQGDDAYRIKQASEELIR